MVLSISNNYLSDFHVAPKQTARWSRRFLTTIERNMLLDTSIGYLS